MKALRRFLATEGKVGYVPDWYPVIKAARYLGVPPWELVDRPAYWLHVALAAQGAEVSAEQRKSPKSSKKG